MISKNTRQFLTNLAANNDRDWFNSNKDLYISCKDEFVGFATELLKALRKVDETIPDLDPAKCVYRIYRDVRFSKNKKPYKNHFAVYFSPEGRKTQKAGYYLHIEPGNTFAGGGSYLPDQPILNKIRQEIDYNGEEFLKIVTGSAFKKTYKELDQTEKAQTMPRGYDKTNPMADYIKLKSFFADHVYNDKEVFENKNFVKTVVKDFEKIKPLIHFLNRAMD
jgi:uncharacterized protein (TIGR02453 family)